MPAAALRAFAMGGRADVRDRIASELHPLLGTDRARAHREALLATEEITGDRRKTSRAAQRRAAEHSIGVALREANQEIERAKPAEREQQLDLVRVDHEGSRSTDRDSEKISLWVLQGLPWVLQVSPGTRK